MILVHRRSVRSRTLLILNWCTNAVSASAAKPDPARAGPTHLGRSDRCTRANNRDQGNVLVREAPSRAQRSIVEALCSDSMGDPAERAILANIILGSLPELLEPPAKEINLRTIHDTYTRRWISQEDGKGLFRLLTSPEKRHDFLGWLALQMHFTNSLDISDHDLGRAIRAHFGPTTTHELEDQAEQLDLIYGLPATLLSAVFACRQSETHRPIFQPSNV
jgi:hypothetical protein